MTTIFLVTETHTSEAYSVGITVSLWTDKINAEKECDRLNKTQEEPKQFHQCHYVYEVEEMELNRPAKQNQD